DCDAGRLELAPRDTCLAVSRNAASVPHRIHIVFLVCRHVVDSTAPDSGNLAARRAAISIDLRPAVLGPGVSARHVYRLHGAIGRRDRPRIPARDPKRLCVRGICGVDRRVCRTDPPHCAAAIRPQLNLTYDLWPSKVSGPTIQNATIETTI